MTVLPRAVTGTDRYGSPVYGWPLPGVTVEGVLVAPGTSVEGNEAIRQQVDTTCTLYRLPFDLVVDATARLIVRGVTWQAAGDPEPWSNGSWAPGSTLKLTRGEG